ncbi:hypothetical protein pipiens_002337 [Culex pipiens pipiens]|uniref:Uncharacterized protein n=1 Tax=Culex pipiens pipiens TaxID=38569 RepID=A0ABD1DH93_CULPP
MANMATDRQIPAGSMSNGRKTSTFPKLQPSHAAASISSEPGGQEPILPAVLEFPEQHQESFLQAVISELDVNSPNFKLAPVYTLYLCARYRASTHYRPDLQPTERAHKLTVFLHHVANLIQNVVQEQYTDAKILSFWMANSSEFLHFLKSDRHISAFSVQAQEVLAESVQTAFRNLVSIFHVELSQTLNQFLSENIDHDSAAGLVLSVLGSAMALLRRCRVNAALTIQLFSQLFHYINVVCFNKFVTTSHMCTSAWGRALTERLSLLELWAEKQGLELAADCHLAKINQCAQFLQAPKTSVTEVQQLACSCFRLNSLQMGALLSQETIPRNLIDTAVRMAESVADELSRADGREIRLEESPELPLALLLPDDGFSCDVVRGIPAGLVDFLSPFQMANMCRLASQPTSIGLWTVYMHQFNQGRSPSVMSSKLPQPEIQLIKLHKNANGMGLSIVAAKGAGQERLGIYIKSVVTGGAADLDGRLQAGDQLLEVDGQSLIGITQERAADHLVRTGPVVTLKVAKQGAIYHGLATLLQQPSPVIQREIENEFNCNVYDNDGNQRYHFGRSNESLNFHGSSRSMSRRGSLRQPLTPVMTHTTSTPYLSYHDAYRRMSNPDISQGRRFSVSLSNDDILSNDQLQQIHFDPRYRDCRSTVSLNSSFYNRTRSNSLGSIGRGLAAACSTGIPTMPCIPPPIALSKPTRYDTPPSIYVEDYDSRGSSHNSSREMIKIEESVEPEPESPVVAHVPVFEVRIEGPSTESNLSFVADVNLDDIPFIDDDDDEERETRFYTTRSSEEDLRPSAPPPPMPPPYVAAPPPPPPPAPTPVSNSTTLGNIASIMINPGSRRGSNSSCRKTVSFDIITDSGNARSGSQQDINGGTTTYEDDNYSKEFSHTSKPLESESYSCQVRWSVEEQPAEPVRIGHGKVKALTAFYDSLKNGNNNIELGRPMSGRSKRLSSSTPNLGSCVGNERGAVKEKLTTVEEEEILSQLKQWSEFGSMSDELDKKCNLHKSASCEDSVHKVGIVARDDKLDGRRKPISRSTVNLNHYQVVDYNWNHQQPDGFILKKVKLCSKNCTNIESNRIQLRLTYLTGGSCPNLLTSVRPATQRPLSPCQPPPKQTLRQLKRQQNLIKILKAVNRRFAPPDGTGKVSVPVNR